MKHHYRLMLCVAALAAPLAGALAAQEPPPIKGHVLILDNERVLEGEVSRQGDRYVVRRAVGEVTVPAGKALAVCGTLEEAYRLLSARANLHDADERLRLARWCHGVGLRDQAIAEVQAALQLRPGHLESKQLLRLLERPAQAPPAEADSPGVAQTAHAAQPLLEVSADCLTVFSTKVQPILMNTCASCHASGRGGNFVLLRSSDPSGRRSTQQNLSATLRYVCFEQPSASPLLLKACCAHGGAAQPPLPNHQATPVALLQAWVDLVAARNPHLRPHGAPAVAAVPAQPSAVFGAEQAAFKLMPSPSSVQQPLLVKEAPAARAVESYPDMLSTPPAPRQLAPQETAPMLAGDEFDAMAFNRLWHPKQ